MKKKKPSKKKSGTITESEAQDIMYDLYQDGMSQEDAYYMAYIRDED